MDELAQVKIPESSYDSVISFVWSMAFYLMIAWCSCLAVPSIKTNVADLPKISYVCGRQLQKLSSFEIIYTRLTVQKSGKTFNRVVTLNYEVWLLVRKLSNNMLNFQLLLNCALNYRNGGWVKSMQTSTRYSTQNSLLPKLQNYI